METGLERKLGGLVLSTAVQSGAGANSTRPAGTLPPGLWNPLRRLQGWKRYCFTSSKSREYLKRPQQVTVDELRLSHCHLQLNRGAVRKVFSRAPELNGKRTVYMIANS